MSSLFFLFFYAFSLVTLAGMPNSISVAGTPASTSLAASSTANQAAPSTPVNSTGQAPVAPSAALWESVEWRRIVHYRSKGSGWESEIDAPNFFVASDGKTNPKSELEALLNALRSENPQLDEDKSVFCRFPARIEWLMNQHPEIFPPGRLRSCPRLEKWFQLVRGQSASLVFSSFYLNNPSSAFGHTLVRINKQPSERDGRRYELLDYGNNFAANATTSNPLLYAIQGLFGGFAGTFTLLPYYYKVREYNNAESRDLWEYELNLSPEAVNRLVLHLWELGPAYADYWYLTENCSYFMLSNLEMADPNLDLISRLKTYVVPGDTLKTVWETPGLVRNVHYRPSVRAEFLARLKGLNDSQTEATRQIVMERRWPADWEGRPEEDRRLIADAALDGIDYHFAYDVQNPSSPATLFKNQVLVERSRINTVSPRLNLPAPDRETPHTSHGSRRVAVGAFNNSGHEDGARLAYRFSLHDLLDPTRGYPETAQIAFFDGEFALSRPLQRVRLERFALFEVVSLAPRSEFLRSISWRMHVGAERYFFPSEVGGLAAGVTGGPGWTWTLAPDLLFYTGLQGGMFSWAERGGLRAAPSAFAVAGPLVGVRGISFGKFSALAEAIWWPEPGSDEKWTVDGKIGLQYHINEQKGIRLQGRGSEEFQTWSLDALFYY